MKLSDWHVIQYKDKPYTINCYGPIEEFIEDGAVVIPEEEWTVNNMIEITSNLLEDINHHETEIAPRFIVGTMISVGISDDDIKSFMREYMEQIYNRYGY